VHLLAHLLVRLQGRPPGRLDRDPAFPGARWVRSSPHAGQCTASTSWGPAGGLSAVAAAPLPEAAGFCCRYRVDAERGPSAAGHRLRDRLASRRIVDLPSVNRPRDIPHAYRRRRAITGGPADSGRPRGPVETYSQKFLGDPADWTQTDPSAPLLPPGSLRTSPRPHLRPRLGQLLPNGLEASEGAELRIPHALVTTSCYSICRGSATVGTAGPPIPTPLPQ
jgi:hypothetical protein